MLRTLARAIFILGLVLLAIVLYHQTETLRNAQNADGSVDGTKIMILFVSIVAIAIVIGITVAMTIVPAIGESVGSFFYSPDEKVEKDPHADALAKIAQGDYEGAVEEYKVAILNNPDDMHAISEIVHLYCDKLGDTDSAEELLSEALERDWPPEQGAFLASRIVDVYWNYQQDSESALHILSQVIETMPDTKYAANATHRMHEIQRALASGQSAPPLPQSGLSASEAE